MKAAVAAFGIVVSIALAGVAVPAAQARTGLHVRLRQTRSELSQATTELAKMRSGLAAPRVRVATLRKEAARLRLVLALASARLAAAQARLAAEPSPLAAAVAQVRREVAYVQGGVPYSRGQLVSEAALDYVTGHVSDTAYGYLQMVGGVLPPVRANPALAAQAGICGQAAVAFAAIVSRLGFAARSVQFFYDDPAPDAHVADEVLYDGAWHFFDPTFGLFWTDAGAGILSTADVRAGLGTLQKNAASLTNVFEDAVYGNDAWFETDPATKVVIGAWTRK